MSRRRTAQTRKAAKRAVALWAAEYFAKTGYHRTDLAELTHRDEKTVRRWLDPDARECPNAVDMILDSSPDDFAVGLARFVLDKRENKAQPVDDDFISLASLAEKAGAAISEMSSSLADNYVDPQESRRIRTRLEAVVQVALDVIERMKDASETGDSVRRSSLSETPVKLVGPDRGKM